MPHREPLLTLLKNYVPQTYAEKVNRLAFIEFVEKNEDCFERSNLFGHVSASGWIISEDYQYVLLNFHKKLNKWIQFGGHCDGNFNVLAVAEQENVEETGLTSTRLLRPEPFDVDIRYVPDYKNIPEHLHFDVTFLFTADRAEPFRISDESIQIKWVHVDNLDDYVPKEDTSTRPMVAKTRKLATLAL